MHRRLASLAMLVLALAGCGTSSANQKSAIPEGPLVIGISQALTGDLAAPGTGINQGYEVWAKQTNDAGGLLGHKVVLKVYDNQSLVDTATSQVEKLITVDKVPLLLGPYGSVLTIPMSAVTERYRMPFIEGAGGAPGVFSRHFRFVFFVQPAVSQKQAEPFVEYILSLPPDQRPKTAAYPQREDPFVSAAEDGAQARLEAEGIKTVYRQVYPATQTDFAPIAAAVKASGAEIVLGGTLFDDTVAQVRAYIAVQYQPKAIYFTAGPQSAGPFQAALGDKVNGIMTGTGWIQKSKAPANAKFVSDYLAMFPQKDNLVSGEAAKGYSAAQVLGEAVKATGGVDGATLAAWLHGHKVQTIQGTIGWDVDGRPNGSFLLEQLQQGSLHVVWPLGDPNRDASPAYPMPKW